MERKKTRKEKKKGERKKLNESQQNVKKDKSNQEILTKNRRQRER